MAAAVNVQNSEVVVYETPTYRTKLVFDTLTPRPHFIFVQKQRASHASREELQSAFELAGTFLRENRQYDQDAILSFHCGKWYQEHSKEWHAHLCVPYGPYANAADSAIKTVPKIGHWCSARSILDGLKNYDKKQHENYTKYKAQTLSAARSINIQLPISLSSFNNGEFSLVWTSPAPRIGIMWDSSKRSNLASLYDFMNNIRIQMEQHLRQSDKSFENFGCHQCLFVRGQLDTELTQRDCQVFSANSRWERQPIVGYIQMEELQYYKWLPVNLRDYWLMAFDGAEHFVRT